jgi:hypothetical protein
VNELRLLKILKNTLATCIVSNSMKMIASCTDSSSSASGSSTFDSGDEGLDSISTLYNNILSQCYFAERHHERAKSSRMVDDILRMNPNRIKIRFRLLPTTFDII